MTQSVEVETADNIAGDDDWRQIGTVVGNAGTSEFTFILQQFQAKVGDIVALEMDVPGENYVSQRRLYVWARIISISRFNPFFPYEAAQEIAGEGISLEDTILSDTRDQLEAKALILGTTENENLKSLFPLTYPVKPASTVWYPPADMVSELLTGGWQDEKGVAIGSLIARRDVEVTLSAPKLVSRHMAILAMTGGGKTVAARRMIRELIELGYPLLILDPHGDYIGLLNCLESFKSVNPDAEVKLFYPELLMQRDGEGIVETLIAQMTNGLTENQSAYLQGIFTRENARDGQNTLDYIRTIMAVVERDLQGTNPPNGLQGNWRPTVGATRRALRIVSERLGRMETASEMMRKSPKLSHLPFTALPNPFGSPEEIIRPNQTSIL
jgi:uncharacterized protein